MDPTGLVFLRARYYDPSVGRFLTPDTIVPDPLRSMGWNQYPYGYNNPIGYADPSGKNPLLCAGLVIVDGPLSIGDIACAALIGYTLVTGYTLAQNADLPSGSLSVNVPSAAEVVQTVLAINAASTVLINEALETYPLGVPPFELGGFNEGVEPETGNICYPGPNLSNPLEQQPIPFPIPEITAPEYSDFPLEGPKVPDVWMSKRNIGGGSITFDEALQAGANWLGSGYKEIAPGVFRSADGRRQFRITSSDLADPKQGAHAHFESIGSDGRTIIENSHVKITDP